MEKGSRMDTSELKSQMLKKIGSERFRRYWYCLNLFINQKMSKSEFDKSCYRILGRENLPLHNQIIRAILKNAYNAKVPPPLSVHDADPTKVVASSGRSSHVVEDGVHQGGVLGHNQNSLAPILSNGVLSMSPRKVRSGMRERKLRDRPSPLGPNGKADSASHQSTATEDSGGKTIDNGDLTPCDYQKPLEQPENNERFVIRKPADVLGFVQSKNQNNVAVVEDGEEVEQASHLKFSSPLIAPLGIPFCSASTGGARKALPVTHVRDYVSFFDAASLSDSETLMTRMEHIAASQGVGGVTMECANTLNIMLDIYLKRLIRSCVDIVGARPTNNVSKYPIQKQQINGKLINGVWPSNHLHMQHNGGGQVGEQRVHHSISLLDFKVAMELNPQQLGEDWPLLLEKISTQAFEE